MKEGAPLDLIRVIGWNNYQHYKNRNPPWIKLHRELLTSRTWVNCDDATRVLAIAIMLLAAATDNKIPADPKYLQRVAYLNKPPNLKPLFDIQFIEYIGAASICEQTLAPCASTEKETEAEREAEEIVAYGEFKRVLLTVSQFAKLGTKLGTHVDSYVNRLDRWGEESPAKFAKKKSHYATILNWFDRDVKEGKVKAPEDKAKKKVWQPHEYL